MSFTHARYTEGYRDEVGGSSSYSDNPAFDQVVHELSEQLSNLTENVSRLSKQIPLLGTKRETLRVRERIKNLIDETGTGFKNAVPSLKLIIAETNLSYTQRCIQSKLNREYQTLLADFQQLQNEAINKENLSTATARAALNSQQSQQQDLSNTSSSQENQQQHEQLDMALANREEVDYQENLILNREAEIRNIEQSVLQLNELFQDVAHLIHEQGGQLDIISEAVEGVKDNTQRAQVELIQAARYQRNARNRSCLILTILAALFTLIVLTIALT